MKELSTMILADAAHAKLLGREDTAVKDIVIDSRAAGPEVMFVCIIGEINDGHKFAESAYGLGSRVFLMSDEKAAEAMLSAHDDACVILCDDTNIAFRDMAKWYIDDLGVRKIGVTGSVGKTTTKALTAAVLAEQYNVVCAQKNYNTHLGMCMTSFLADDSTDFIVFEMGMDRKNEIHEYCEWVRPETALITVIADSHLERLGSHEAIADAKLEITHFMTDECRLIYNADSPFLDDENLKNRTKMNFTAIPVGKGKDAAFVLSDVELKGIGGVSFRLTGGGESHTFELPLLGEHNAANAALAIACGMQYGIPMELAAAALKNARGTEKRLAFEHVNGMLLLDDSYNANPASMIAGLSVLDNVEAERKIAVLADMYELGSDEIPGHFKVGEKAGEVCDVLFAAGKHADLYEEGARKVSERIKVFKFPDAKAAEDAVLAFVKSGDAVLVKGSNSTKVSVIAEKIRDLK